MVGITEIKETQINTWGLLGVTIKKKHTVCQLKIKCLFIIPLYVTFFRKTSIVLGLCKYCKPTFSIHLKKIIYINVVWQLVQVIKQFANTFFFAAFRAEFVKLCSCVLNTATLERYLADMQAMFIDVWKDQLTFNDEYILIWSSGFFTCCSRLFLKKSFVAEFSEYSTLLPDMSNIAYMHYLIRFH